MQGQQSLAPYNKQSLLQHQEKSMLMRYLGLLIFRLSGWSYDDDHDWLDKQVIIGFPHTSNMDAVRSTAVFSILKIRTHTLIKEELFR